MNKIFSNKLNTYINVLELLETNPELTGSYTLLQGYISELALNVGEIKKLVSVSEVETSGVTTDKMVAKERMAKSASLIAAAGAGYAASTGNNTLEAQLDYNFSDIRYAKDSEAYGIASAIESNLRPLLPELADYQITQEDLDSLLATSEDYFKMIGGQGIMKNSSIQNTNNLSLIFRRTDDLLKNKMDRFMKRISDKNQEFYNSYLTARRVIDL
ncbi:MAG: hypothetical protein ACOYXB_04540 [Bacteroidota bacterium]